MWPPSLKMSNLLDVKLAVVSFWLEAEADKQLIMVLLPTIWSLPAS